MAENELIMKQEKKFILENYMKAREEIDQLHSYY